MTDKNEVSFREAVRARPGMYFGSNSSKGIINLLCGLFSESIELTQTEKISIAITVFGQSKFLFEVYPVFNSSIVQKKITGNPGNKVFYLRLLPEVTTYLNIKDTHHNFQISFQLDNDVFPNTSIDYDELFAKFSLLAVLNRNAEILLRDETQKHYNQNFFCFPNGVFHLYDIVVRDTLGKPVFEIYYDKEVNGYKYQIAIAYRADWFSSAYITSFGNDTHTINGGDLAKGVFEGLCAAIKKYITNKKQFSFETRKKDFYNGLIIVCSVRGHDLEFGGSFKETLAMPAIRKQSKKIVQKLVFDYLVSNSEKIDKMLWRFDKKQSISSLF